eukprot:m.349287 g.349287  ORF g.349287 m.349287 type:complete len:50 (-) comp27950_c0_seq2:2913-3062(-)
MSTQAVNEKRESSTALYSLEVKLAGSGNGDGRGLVVPNSRKRPLLLSVG